MFVCINVTNYSLCFVVNCLIVTELSYKWLPFHSLIVLIVNAIEEQKWKELLKFKPSVLDINAENWSIYMVSALVITNKMAVYNIQHFLYLILQANMSNVSNLEMILWRANTSLVMIIENSLFRTPIALYNNIGMFL